MISHILIAWIIGSFVIGIVVGKAIALQDIEED